MKKRLLLPLMLLCSVLSFGQSAGPKGFTAGTVLLANGTKITGYVKDQIKKSASVVFWESTTEKKTSYEGSDINGVVIDGTSYLCIQGDFFKSLSIGKINFLQKSSNAAGKISYHGAEPVMSSGTEGKIGDYFTYSGSNLKLLSKKTMDSFINNDLASCPQAIEKAKSLNGDIARMAEAIDLYNTYSK